MGDLRAGPKGGRRDDQKESPKESRKEDPKEDQKAGPGNLVPRPTTTRPAVIHQSADSDSAPRGVLLHFFTAKIAPLGGG